MSDLDRRVRLELNRLAREKSGLRQGVVTAVSPLEVSVGGSDVSVFAQALDGVELAVNDRVSIEVQGTDLIVLGRNTDDPQAAGGGSVSPSGPAGGDLDGNYPNPDLGVGVVGASEVASSLKPSGSASGTDESLRRLGTGSTHAAAGNDGRFPTSGEKNALAGTSGTPGSGNKYVTDGDSRLSDDRDPTVHAVSHKDGGSDELKLSELGEPTGNVDFNGFELEHVGAGTQADSGVNLSQLDLVRMGFTVKPQADYATVDALDSYVGTGTGVLEASSNGDLLDALGLESEHWDYSLTFLSVGSPQAICRDGSGNFYVTFDLAGQYRVWKFNSSGQSVNSFSGSPVFGANGTGNGQFGGRCRGIAVDGSGNIYVADTYNHRIQKFNSSGVYQAKVGSLGSGNGQFQLPIGVAVDGSGNIYVADTYNRRIQKFNSSLTYQSKFGSTGTGDGEFAQPYGVAVDGSGNIYVADPSNQRIQKFNSSGTYLAKFDSAGTGDGEFAQPYGVAVDGSGNIYVADTYNHRIQKFNSGGTYLAKFGSFGQAHGQFRFPRDVAVDGSGNLFVPEYSNERVEKLLYTASSSVSVGQTVLVKDQASTGPHVDHGIYDITATGGPSAKWELTRRDDVDNGQEIPSGLLVNARQRGPVIPGGMWYVSNPDPITVNSTALVWEQFQPGGPPTAHAFSHAYDGVDPIVVEDWIEVGSGGSAPAFQNSWVNFGSGLETAGFYKDPLGIVHVKGVIKSGTTASCFQLPAGYRPAATEIFACQGNNGSDIIARIDIGASGNIGVQTASATFLSLSGITFRAA